MPRTKAKLSVTIASDVVRDVDRAVHAKRWANRSAAIEAVLKAWIVRDRTHQRDVAIEAHYRGTDRADRAEDEQWADAAWSSFVDITRNDAEQAERQPARRRRKKP